MNNRYGGPFKTERNNDEKMEMDFATAGDWLLYLTGMLQKPLVGHAGGRKWRTGNHDTGEGYTGRGGDISNTGDFPVYGPCMWRSKSSGRL